MRRKLTMAIMSLVIAASLLTTATFAWFNMSETVTVGSMDMTVQTVGSLYIRTHDYATNIDGNTRAFRTSIDIPTDSVTRNETAGIQPTVSLYRFAQWLVTDIEDGGAGLAPTVLDPVTDGGATETQEEAYIRALTAYFTGLDGAFDVTTLTGEGSANESYTLNYFTNPGNYPELSGEPLTFDVKERMMRAENPRSSTQFVIAGDNMDYGKWNFDLLSAAQDQTVKLGATLKFDNIKRYSASISVLDVLRDYLAAYTVEIYEFDHNDTDAVYNADPIAIGKINVTEEEIAAMGGGDPSDVITTIQENVFNVTFTFIGDGAPSHIGVFPRDEVRSFEIYTYIDGTTRNLTKDNLGNILPDQNHLTEVATTLNLVFDVVVSPTEP